MLKVHSMMTEYNIPGHTEDCGELVSLAVITDGSYEVFSCWQYDFLPKHWWVWKASPLSGSAVGSLRAEPGQFWPDI